MNFSPPRKRSPLVLELTPLIDVVFLLLIFFMVSTTFVSQPSALEVDLPTSDNEQLILEGNDVGITLSADGQVALDGRGVTMKELRADLRRIAAEDPTTQVVVRADRGLTYQRLVDVMSLAHDLGLSQFSLATDDGGAN